ncbi:MAG: aa3-type cytochrome c oxidase subunit IV [Alphaproteobacteria bacterium HGW-Alphaproteobacteria-16]|nr:MAG: aa3-type cytochrome c oxidase subunit IV [Alphaproteobacteria bacterium HGW-Alphaproteobacteria-16]
MAQTGDFKAHEQTYGGFMRLLKVGTVITIILAAFVIWLIAS